MTEPTTAPVTEAIEAPPAKTLAEVAADVWGPSEPAVVAEPAPEPEPAPAPVAKEEPAKEEPPKEPDVSARIAAAKRAEAKLAREREADRAAREDLDRRRADLDTREKRIKLIEEDPVKFFEEFKADPKAFLEKLAGEHKPEAVQDRKLNGIEKELSDLKAEIARRDQVAEEAQRARDQRALEQEAGESFIKHVSDTADKYPYLTQEFTEGEAIELAFRELNAIVGHDSKGQPVTRLQAYAAEHGDVPDNDVIAEHLNAIAERRIQARSKSAWRKHGDAPPAGQAPSHGDLGSAPQVKGASPRTLSARDTSQRAAAPRTQWSQEQADEESIKILEASFRKHG